jgi:mRNA interferase MazF
MKIASMTNYRFGDIVLISFYYASSNQDKKRPALVILDSGDSDLVLAPITSQSKQQKGDCFLSEWEDANLLKPSWARIGKINTLEKYLVIRKLGELNETDKQIISKAWHKLYLLNKQG